MLTDKIIVLGGSGFLGSRIIQALQKAVSGEVTCGDLVSNGSLNCEYIKLDMLDINDIIKLPLLEQNINITLLEPNGGEVFNVSDNINIIWNVKKIYDQTINLFYSINSGKDWSILKLNAMNSGKSSWKIPYDIKSSNFCKIKVQSTLNADVFDITDGLFTINGGDTAFKIIGISIFLFSFVKSHYH